MVFELEQESYLPLFNHLSIFPAFYSNRPTTCRAIADSDVAGGITTDKATVYQVSIYLRDFSDMDLLRNTVEDMALWFPPVRRLNLSIERPSQIVSLIRIPSLRNTQYALQKYPEFTKFTEILSCVTELTYLHFLPWERTATLFNGSGVLANDGKMAQAKAWGATCPALSEITFLDGVTLTRDNHDSVWKV